VAGEEPTATGRRGVDRVSIQDAARRLGISEGAVRKRVTRGTLHHDKATDGRVYVYLDAGVDAGQDAGVDANSSALIFQLRDEISYLREESRRKDEIIMQQAMTMRQLTAPTVDSHEEPSESDEPGSSTSTAPNAGEYPQEAAERSSDAREVLVGEHRSWWRRVFGR
jgi:hypothetical protein